jgi:integrase/recombinase XerC
MIRAWLVDMLEQNFSTRTVNRKLSCLKSYWHFLIKKDHALKDPTKKILSPKTKKTLPVFLKVEEMAEIFEQETKNANQFETTRDRLIIELFYQTGIRLSELINICDRDVDLKSCILKVTGKRNKQRLIPFGIPLKKLIEEYISVRGEYVESEPEHLLVRQCGQPLYSQMVYRIVNQKLTSIATLSKNSPHVLRHTFATTLLNQGAELNAVKELLGHKSLAATEVYTHTTFEELKKVYKQAHPRA